MSPVTLVSAIMLISLMLNAGLQCNLENLEAVLKNYKLIGKALLANVVLVPLYGVLLVNLFHLQTYIAVGFLLMAVAPGAPFLPQAAGRQAGGSLGMAIALAFILPAVSIFTIPITAPLIFPHTGEGHAPLAKFLVTLVGFQLLPLVLGTFVASRNPDIAAKLDRPLVITFFAAVVVLLGMSGEKIVTGIGDVYGSNGMWAMLAIVLLSIATGWFLGGPLRTYRTTLGIGTALRNIGLCLLLATSNFPGTVVTATVVTYFVIQFVVSLLFRIVMRRLSPAQAAA